MIPIAIVGVGKIARDQHVPHIAAGGDFSLAATVTHHDGVDGVPNFATIAEMRAAVPVAAVAICTPPLGRLALVEQALAHRLDILIEKPPAGTTGEARAIADLAATHGRVLYAAWHSREAAAVAPARDWLDGRTIRSVEIAWQEDVRIWHPGQEWIWEPGIGVFDPGINALSVLTAILPRPVLLHSAVLRFPEDRAAPIAAALEMNSAGVPIHASFDFDYRGADPRWDIRVETDDGVLLLTHGASRMFVDGAEVALDAMPEYARVYRRFAELITAGQSDVDLAPFGLVTDAFLVGRRETVQAFRW